MKSHHQNVPSELLNYFPETNGQITSNFFLSKIYKYLWTQLAKMFITKILVCFIPASIHPSSHPSILCARYINVMYIQFVHCHFYNYKLFFVFYIPVIPHKWKVEHYFQETEKQPTNWWCLRTFLKFVHQWKVLNWMPMKERWSPSSPPSKIMLQTDLHNYGRHCHSVLGLPISLHGISWLIISITW